MMAKTLVLGITSMLMLGGDASAIEPLNLNFDTDEPPTFTRELVIEQIIQMKSEEHEVDGDLAQAIAFCESTYRQYASNGQVLRGIENSKDVGLFQINEKYHLDKSREMGYDIYSLEGNIDYAMELLKKDGSRHWSASKPCWNNKVAVR